MRSRRKTAVCGLALLSLFILCGCGAQRQTSEWFAMDTVITAAASCGKDALNAAETETYRIDALLAAQKESSEIAAVNNGARTVSEETAALVARRLDKSEEETLLDIHTGEWLTTEETKRLLADGTIMRWYEEQQEFFQKKKTIYHVRPLEESMRLDLVTKAIGE